MEWLDADLTELRARHLLRTLRPVGPAGSGRVWINGREYINLSSNDYLGLAGHPGLLEESVKAAEKYGTSSSASRLMSGDLHIHHLLEKRITDLVGKEKSLLFGSGYLANTGCVSAICSRKDVVFLDRLCHASIVDGVFLSGARFFRFQHNDPGHLEALLKRERGKYNRALIITESLFSMDGDMAPLAEIVEAKERHDALFMLDEAHAVGIFGERGAGLAEERGLSQEIDIIVGTFGKALGSYGAYAAASGKLIDYLINSARSFIYSTALPPCVIGASIAAIKMLTDEPFRRSVLAEKSAYFRSRLKTNGLDVRGEAQIASVIVGANDTALRLADMLQQNGIFALAIRPPTVPAGEARIRFSVTCNHSTKDLAQAADVF